MWGYQQLAALVADVNAGRVRGPDIHSLSSGFDGSPVKWAQTQLVDERLLVSAGLSPYQALRGATTMAAEYLHMENEVGAIKTGARADLLVLDANPLRDIAAVRRIYLVTLRGQIIDHG